eukprot:scaffold138808_cov18-Tisochrysis_lutea.AAC.1
MQRRAGERVARVPRSGRGGYVGADAAQKLPSSWGDMLQRLWCCQGWRTTARVVPPGTQAHSSAGHLLGGCVRCVAGGGMQGWGAAGACGGRARCAAALPQLLLDVCVVAFATAAAAATITVSATLCKGWEARAEGAAVRQGASRCVGRAVCQGAVCGVVVHGAAGGGVVRTAC